MYHVFVYGTLRPGESNAPCLAHASHRGRARTAARFTLLDAGAYPAALDYGRHAVHGDIYTVDAHTLAALDSLEGYPVFYTRRIIDTSLGRAWIYLWAASLNRHWSIIESGDWPRHRELRAGDLT